MSNDPVWLFVFNLRGFSRLFFLDFSDILLLFSKVSTIFKVLKEFLGSLSVRWPDRIVWLQLWRRRQGSIKGARTALTGPTKFLVTFPFFNYQFISASFAANIRPCYVSLIPSTFLPTTFFADYWRGLTERGLTASWHCVNLALFSLERSLIAKKDRINWKWP